MGFFLVQTILNTQPLIPAEEISYILVKSISTDGVITILFELARETESIPETPIMQLRDVLGS
jgi:hypothetical protein